MALKTTRKTLTAVDKQMNAMVAGMYALLGTSMGVILACETDYEIYFLADCVSGGKISYRVTDHAEEYTDQMTFASFTEARDFYREVVGAGSWSEFKLQVKRNKILDDAGLMVKSDDENLNVINVFRKRDKTKFGYIENGKFSPDTNLSVVRGETSRNTFRAVNAYINARM